MQPGDLLKQLTDDLTLAEHLLTIAAVEHQALVERDLPGLEKSLNDKQPLIDQLIQHGAERARLLTARGLPTDRQGLAALLADAAEKDDVLACADQLAQRLEACREANEQNGRLIRSNQAAVGSALAILRGAADTPDVYDNRGTTTKVPRQRPLSQA